MAPKEEAKINIPPGRSDERTIVQNTPEVKSNEELLQLPANTKEASLTVRPSEAIKIRPENFKTKRTRSYKQISMDKRASNLRRLQKSMNPLKTLSDLERSKADKLFTNEEELNAVLQDLIMKNSISRGNDTKAGQTYMRNLVSKLRSLKDAGRLYKEGGIIKAQNGFNGIPTQIEHQMPVSGTFAQQQTKPGLQMETIDAINAADAAAKSAQYGFGDKGGFYYNDPGIGKYISPIMSGIRYFSQMIGRNKMYREQKKALEAGRVYQSEVGYSPNFPRDSVAIQQQRNKIQNALSTGIKPITANPIDYYSSKLMRDSKLWDSFADLTAQASAYEASQNERAEAYRYKDAVDRANRSYQNRQVDASINAGLHQLEAARLGEMQASRDNLLYEMQQNMYQDQQSIMQASIAKHKQDNDKKYQAELQRLFKAD